MLWKSQIFKLHSRKKSLQMSYHGVSFDCSTVLESQLSILVHVYCRIQDLNPTWITLDIFFYHFPTPPHQAPRVLGNAHRKSRSYPVSRIYECVSLLKLRQSGSNSNKLSVCVCVPVSTASRNPCSYLSFSTTITRLGDTNHTLPLTHTHTITQCHTWWETVFPRGHEAPVTSSSSFFPSQTLPENLLHMSLSELESEVCVCVCRTKRTSVLHTAFEFTAGKSQI